MIYNRVVKDLNGLSQEEFLKKVEEKFQVEKTGSDQVHPGKKGEFGMVLRDGWYRLQIREEYRSEDAVDGLDVFSAAGSLAGAGAGNQKTKDRYKN